MPRGCSAEIDYLEVADDTQRWRATGRLALALRGAGARPASRERSASLDVRAQGVLAAVTSFTLRADRRDLCVIRESRFRVSRVTPARSSLPACAPLPVAGPGSSGGWVS